MELAAIEPRVQYLNHTYMGQQQTIYHRVTPNILHAVHIHREVRQYLSLFFYMVK